MQGDWDLYLPTAEFALNLTKSASTGYSIAFVLYGKKPTLLLKHAILSLVDVRIASLAERVQGMQNTVDAVRSALNNTATIMQRSANRRLRDTDIIVGGYAWLATDHLKLPSALSRKLALHFIGPFLVTSSVGAVFFQLQLPTDWKIHNVFHANQLKPAVGVTVDGSAASPF